MTNINLKYKRIKKALQLGTLRVCYLFLLAVMWVLPCSVTGFFAFLFVFFFNDTATTEIYTLSLHDALPICWQSPGSRTPALREGQSFSKRSEEHTSELQSHSDLVCRLLLEKKKNKEKEVVVVKKKKKKTKTNQKKHNT